MDSRQNNLQTGYPLSALFVLLAACGVVSALLTPVVHALVAKTLTIGQIVAASIISGILVGIVGAVIGLYHYRPWRGVAWGLVTGGSIGLLIGPLTLAPPQALGSLITMSIGGSLVLLMTGAMFGFRTKDAS